MAKFNDKLSTILNSQLPEYIVTDHPKFVDFLKVYYQLLESAEVKVTEIQNTTGILLETETGQTNNLVLNATRIDTARTPLDGDDKILLEETQYGKFQRGETVQGQKSKVTAVVLVEDLDNNRLIISAQDKFLENEIIVGLSSNATATINRYTVNPVNNIVDLINFRDPDKVIAHFLTNMRDEFLQTLPESLDSNVNKRNLIKNVKSLYRSKGTLRGHETFFRLLFGETPEIIYPRENILKASDGQFDSQKILRVIAKVGDPARLIGRSILGVQTKCTATVENLQKFQIGDDEVTELILNRDSIVGDFSVGEEIQGTASDADDYFIKADITGIPGTKNVNNDGSLYATTDTIGVVAGGEGATFQIGDIGPGSVTDVVIDDAGTGYEIGDVINFNNSGTSGKNASAFVKIVNGGFAGESGTTDMSTDDRIILEDDTTRGDSYEGRVIVQEANTDLKQITDIFIVNGGTGYLSLPDLTITSTLGTGANLYSYGDEIGKVINIKTVEHGKKYETSPTPPTLVFFNNLILKSITGGNIVSGDTLTSGAKSGTVSESQPLLGLYKVKDVSGGSFAIGDTVTSQSGVTAVVAKADVANATVNVAAVSDTDGAYISERGKLSETTMRIQDSLYYQDFSYVVKIGRSINEWRDAFKKTMHTSGFYFTGQVSISSRLNVRTQSPIIGSVSGAIDTGLFAVANTLFSTIFGRRLGTQTDGTTLRANPLNPGTIDSDTNTSNHFASNTRDLTLFSGGLEYDIVSRIRRTIVDENGIPVLVKHGFAYAGPKYKTLNTYGNTLFGTSNPGSGITFQRLEELKIFGTKTSLDGKSPIFLLTSNEVGQQLKMNFAIPSETAFNADLFSNTLTKFDRTDLTFDDTTP